MTANHYSSAAIEDATSPAIRCFEDKEKKATAVANVAAGQSVAFKASNTMGHPGPVLFYMAKVPAGQRAASWDASGNVWFKIHEEGATTDASGVHFKTGEFGR
jgi:hypothetical protein